MTSKKNKIRANLLSVSYEEFVSLTSNQSLKINGDAITTIVNKFKEENQMPKLPSCLKFAGTHYQNCAKVKEKSQKTCKNSNIYH